MNIINLKDVDILSNNTVDGDIITVDNSLITVDSFSSVLYINLVPRIFDDVKKIHLIDELTKKEDIITINDIGLPVVYHKSYISVPILVQKYYKDGGTYEIIIKGDNDLLIYRGKVYVADDNDLENYKLIKKATIYKL